MKQTRGPPTEPPGDRGRVTTNAKKSLRPRRVATRAPGLPRCRFVAHCVTMQRLKNNKFIPGGLDRLDPATGQSALVSWSDVLILARDDGREPGVSTTCIGNKLTRDPVNLSRCNTD
jgi:hypothetical protein